MTLNFNDFQKQDIKFDIVKLQESYKEIINITPEDVKLEELELPKESNRESD